MSPLFTIIIAGYQCEPYLPKCLASVANQTFGDFEAICYVEESTDNSLAICQEWARRDTRFIVATGPQSGAVATTRNYGIDHARGEYLVVVDGDDWISTDMLEKLAAKLSACGPVDVLAFAGVSTSDASEKLADASRLSNFRSQDQSEVFSGLEAIRRTGRNHGKMHNQTVLNIYRLDFLRENGLRQSDGLLMEDFHWTPRVWFFAKRFAYLDEVFYFYRRRSQSLTTEASGRILLHLAQQFVALSDFVSAHTIPADILNIWSNQWISILFWFLFHPVTSRKSSDTDRQKAFEILLKDDRKKAFLRHVTHSSLPKRMATPLIFLAAKGWQLPAKLFFRYLYYPMLNWLR